MVLLRTFIPISFFMVKHRANGFKRSEIILIVRHVFFKQSFHLEISSRSYSSDDLLNTCRICRDETVSESLISPCNCSGTLGKCHVQCLEKWLSRANKNSCEICGYAYQTMKLPRSFKEVSSTRVKTVCAYWQTFTSHFSSSISLSTGVLIWSLLFTSQTKRNIGTRVIYVSTFP